VATNVTAQEEGRLVIILLDRTIPVGEPSITAKRIAAAAVEQLAPSDLAAVVSTSNRAVQNLTSDHARLLRAINQADLSTDISDEGKEIEAAVFALTGRTWSTLNDGRCQCGLCVLETITSIADAVQGPSRRRKVLFFIGSDLLLQAADPRGKPDDDVGCQKRLKDTREVMFAAVDRANLTIHSLDPTGLALVTPTSRASSTVRPGSGPTGSAAMTSSIADHLLRQGNLQVLPARTAAASTDDRCRRGIARHLGPDWNHHVRGVFDVPDGTTRRHPARRFDRAEWAAEWARWAGRAGRPRARWCPRRSGRAGTAGRPLRSGDQ